MRPPPSRWLPPGYDVATRRHPLGRLAPRLHEVRDSGALVDAVDATSFGPDERFPYWAEVWPSALALARFLARRDLRGTSAVELGCGMGLAGVAAALAGAEVLFTDYDPHALAFARANHALNLGRPGRTLLLDWRDPPRGVTAELALASDVLYEKRFLEPFLQTLRRILVPGGTAFVAEPGRKIAEGAVELLEAAGFRRSLHLEEVERYGRLHPIWIHGLTRPQTPGGNRPHG